MEELRRIFANTDVLSPGSKAKVDREQNTRSEFPKIIEVWNKIDLIEDSSSIFSEVFVDTTADSINSIDLPTCVVPISAKSGSGFDRFIKIVSEIAHGELVDATVFIPYLSKSKPENSDQQHSLLVENKSLNGGGVIGMIYEKGEVVYVENNETGTVLHCRLPIAVIEKLKKSLDIKILT